VTYTVRWKRSALDQLAQLWLDAPDRSQVTAAVAEIDRLLATRPYDESESRPDDIRILFSPPIGVFFEVKESTRIVYVLRVWSF
jgi:hypothetical protein